MVLCILYNTSLKEFIVVYAGLITSDVGVRAIPKRKAKKREGINSFDIREEEERGSEVEEKVDINSPYSPPAEAETGNITDERLERRTPRIERIMVVTTDQRIVVPKIFPPFLFFLRLAVPAATVTKETIKKRMAAAPVIYDVILFIIANREEDDEKVKAVAPAISRAAK